MTKLQPVSTAPDSPDAVGEAARACFASGWYCAESVLLAVARSEHVDNESLTRMATGLCGGLANTRGPCGAVTGAVLAMGLVLGRSSASASDQPIYSAARRLNAEFERSFGARDCHELLGCDLGTPEGQANFKTRRLARRCMQFTGKAAELARRILDEQPRGAAAHRLR